MLKYASIYQVYQMLSHAFDFWIASTLCVSHLQVAIITPFNFPLEIPLLQVLGALYMGNKPLLKVDSKVCHLVFSPIAHLLVDQFPVMHCLFWKNKNPPFRFWLKRIMRDRSNLRYSIFIIACLIRPFLLTQIYHRRLLGYVQWELSLNIFVY